MTDGRDSKLPPPESKRKQTGLLGFLRRGPLKQESQTFLEENALWRAHELAERANAETTRDVQRLRSGLTKDRTALESIVDRGRTLARRSEDFTRSSQRLIDGYERLALLSLNTGLEANRIGDKAGRALGLVAEDIRSHSTTGSELARGLGDSLGELTKELESLVETIEQSRALGTELAHTAEHAETASAEGQRALGEIRERLKKATGSDPETMRAIAEVTEHARALVSGLGTLTGKVPERLVIAAVRPVLEPLLRLLASDEEGP